MTKIKFTSDPNNTVINGSTNIIVGNLNKSLKLLDLYDENGPSIHYDCIANDHGLRPNSILTVYETNFPKFILNNLNGRFMLGVSKANMEFAVDAGYPAELCKYVPLGVDSSIWRPVERTKYHDKFVVLSFSESQTRGGFLHVLDAVGRAFKGKNDVVLVLKDRVTTGRFREVVAHYQDQVAPMEVVLDDRDLTDFEEQNQLYSNADVMLYLNHSSTWGMTAFQSLSCGLPLCGMQHSGPAEYLNGSNGLPVSFSLVEITDDLIMNLQSFGLRNYLFGRSSYHVPPYWAWPNIDDVEDKLKWAYNNKSSDWMKEKSNNARQTAINFSWEKSALGYVKAMEEWGF
jgi:glycosyltransferase involved in cell wall biosynthesis